MPVWQYSGYRVWKFEGRFFSSCCDHLGVCPANIHAHSFVVITALRSPIYLRKITSQSAAVGSHKTLQQCGSPGKAGLSSPTLYSPEVLFGRYWKGMLLGSDLEDLHRARTSTWQGLLTLSVLLLGLHNF